MKRTVLLTAALVFLLTVPISAASLFSDVRQTDWFASYVETARDLGIVSGYPDGSFKPSRRVSYGEFLAMAMRGQDTDFTMPMADLGITDADLADQYSYTQSIVTDSTGKLKGSSWQACSAKPA